MKYCCLSARAGIFGTVFNLPDWMLTGSALQHDALLELNAVSCGI